MRDTVCILSNCVHYHRLLADLFFAAVRAPSEACASACLQRLKRALKQNYIQGVLSFHLAFLRTHGSFREHMHVRVHGLAILVKLFLCLCYQAHACETGRSLVWYGLVRQDVIDSDCNNYLELTPGY